MKAVKMRVAVVVAVTVIEEDNSVFNDVLFAMSDCFCASILGIGHPGSYMR